MKVSVSERSVASCRFQRCLLIMSYAATYAMEWGQLSHRGEALEETRKLGSVNLWKFQVDEESGSSPAPESCGQ